MSFFHLILLIRSRPNAELFVRQAKQSYLGRPKLLSYIKMCDRLLGQIRRRTSDTSN